MYYLIGDEACREKMVRVCGLSRKRVPNESALKLAYEGFLKRYQPNIPVHPYLQTKIVADRKIEDKLIDEFRKPSILDDLDRYTDFNFLENGSKYRIEIQHEVRYFRKIFKEFCELEPDFWQMFQLVINYIICPFSNYSNGGSDSNFIGMLFICNPSQIPDVDLYELLIHEYTHNAMFLDEMPTPHYRSDDLLVHSRNFAVASISGMKRPLDKVLHSIVIATEIMLHREKTLGHHHPTIIHPPSKKLKSNISRSIRSMRKLKNFDALMSDRGRELLDICDETISNI